MTSGGLEAIRAQKIASLWRPVVPFAAGVLATQDDAIRQGALRSIGRVQTAEWGIARHGSKGSLESADLVLGDCSCQLTRSSCGRGRRIDDSLY